MKLRTQLLLFLIAYVVVWLASMSGIFNGLAMRGYHILEDESFETNIERLDSAMNDLIGKSELILSDWVEWDDTYRYIHAPNEAYIKSNISSGVMMDQRLDYILIYDSEDELLDFFKLTGGLVGEVDIPEISDELINHKNQSGIMVHDGRPLVFSTRQVTSTDEMALRKGLMVFAYYLGIDDIRTIEDKLELDFRLVSSHEAYDGPENRIAVYEHGNYKTALFRYGYVNSPLGIALQFTHPLSIIALGKDTMHQVLIASFLVFIIISMVLYIIVRYFVTRISLVGQEINQITTSGDLSQRLETSGGDEISMLATDVNSMLDQIERMNKQLSVYASLDMMTGVYNRRIGFEKLEALLKTFNQEEDRLTICYIDINNLKIVNDTHGHSAGDDMIISIARAIRENMDKEDIACRIGGDEFLMVFNGKNVAQATSKVAGIEYALSQMEKDKPYHVSISKGFLEYDGVMDINAFIEKADHFMYEDKMSQKRS